MSRRGGGDREVDRMDVALVRDQVSEKEDFTFLETRSHFPDFRARRSERTSSHKTFEDAYFRSISSLVGTHFCQADMREGNTIDFVSQKVRCKFLHCAIFAKLPRFATILSCRIRISCIIIIVIIITRIVSAMA